MTMNGKRRSYAMLAGVLVAAGVLGYAVRGALATVPATGALVYSGVLLDAAGSPVNSGTQDVGVTLFAAASGGTSVCAPATQTVNFAGKAGTFRIALGDDCVPAIKANPGLFVQIKVGTTDLLPRTPLAAVPYAIEASVAATAATAANATNATNASTATGALNTRIALVESNVATLTTGKADAVVTNGTKQYSLGATYCGQTATSYAGGSVGGYASAKALCQAACAGSASAHLCTADELVRSVSLGIAVPGTAWYAGGMGNADSPIVDDCGGFTDTATKGHTWAQNKPSYFFCTTQYPLNCCD